MHGSSIIIDITKQLSCVPHPAISRGSLLHGMCHLLTPLSDMQVWKVEFNRLGTCLGVATDSQRVYVYRPNFVGEWQCVSIVQGTTDAMGSEGGDE